jgi:hypothetical protein
MAAKSNAYRLLVGKPQGKRPRLEWLDNNKMDLGEISWGGMDIPTLRN